MGGVRVMLANDRLRVAGEGWAADADLTPLLRRAMGANAGCTESDHFGPEGRTFPPSEALVPLRDASGAGRGQLLVTRYMVSAPLQRGAPQQSGVHVRDPSGFLILP